MLKPKLLKEHSHTADYPCNCSIEQLWFFEEQNVVANYIKYEDTRCEAGAKILHLTGGTEEDRIRVRSYFDTLGATWQKVASNG